MTPIEKYIHNHSEYQQAHLLTMYHLIKELLPAETSEKISYGLATFYLKENLIHFGAMKHHLGFYPTASPIKAFQNDLIGFKTSKGTVQFPYEQEIPKALIRKMVLFRLKEVLHK